MAGRPTKYSPETATAIVQALGTGSTRKAACEAAGISDETFSRWGKAYVEFVDAVKKAEAEAITRRVSRLDRAGEGGVLIAKKVTVNTRTGVETTEETYAQPQWQADAWLLERRYPEDFGRRDKMDVTHRHDPVIQQRAAALAAETGQPVETVLAQFDQFAGAAN